MPGVVFRVMRLTKRRKIVSARGLFVEYSLLKNNNRGIF